MLRAATPTAPRQFGPTMRSAERRATAPIACCKRAPSSPISEKPADSTTAARTPRSAQASTASSTPSGGTAITASSGASGSSARLAYAGIAWTIPPLRLIG